MKIQEKKVTLQSLVILILLSLNSISLHAASPPSTVSYQGFLTNAAGDAIVSASYGIKVEIFEALTGGTATYTETHSSVAVSNGRFSIDLGSGTSSETWATAADFSKALWLQLTIDTAGVNETLSPRVALSPAPYARQALTIADNSVTASKIATAVAGDGLAGGGGTVLSINVDSSTLEVSSDSLQVKDAGVTEDKLAANLSFDDGDALNLSGINSSSSSEGLILPQATDVSAANAEGQLSWDSDDNTLVVGDLGSSQLTMVTTSGTQTLTNKTLTSPTLTTPTLTTPTINTGASLAGTITGTPTFSEAVILTTPDINGGSVDGAPVGASSASTGSFTTLTASGTTSLGSTLTVTGAVTLSGGGALSGTFTGTPTFSEAVILSTPDINGGSIDGAAIGANSASTGVFSTLSATGAVSLSNNLAVTGTTTFTGASTTTGIVTLNNGSTSAGVLKIYEDSDTGANFTAFQAGNATADVTYTLPTADGTSGQVLSTDGSGTLSWAASSSSSGATTALGNLASVAINTSLLSDTDATDDLGSSSKKWKDLYLSGSATIGGGTFSGTISGTPTFSDAVILSQPDINGGSVDGAAIGANSASTGTFTTLSANSTTTLSGGATLSGANTITGAIQGASPLILEGATDDANETTFAVTDPTSDRTITFPDTTGTVSLITATETLTNKTLTSPSLTGAALSGGGSMAGTFTGTPTLSDAIVLSQPDINGGSVDGAAIGSASASTGVFTTLSATGAVSLSNTLTVTGTTTFTGASTTVGIVSLNNGSTSAGVLKIYEDSDTGSNYTAFQAGNATADVTYTLPTADGTSGQVLSTDGSGVLSWSTSSSSSGATTALGNLASVAINTSLLSDTDATDDLGSSSKKWKDLYLSGSATIGGGAFSGTISGTPTFSDAVVLSQPDINGGSVDGAAIGANSASSGTFTTLSANSTTTLSGGATLSGATTITGAIQGASPLILEGATDDANETTFAVTDPTSDRTITFPDTTGTVSLITATETLTNKTLTSPSLTGAALSGGGSMAGTFTGTPTLSDAVILSQPDINGGSVDGAAIGSASASTGAFTTLSATGAVSLSNTLTVTGSSTFTGASTSVGIVSLNNGSTSAGVLKIYEDSDNGSNFTAFQAGNATADVTYTLPTADGSNGQVLSTDGSGVLSWSTGGSGDVTQTGTETLTNKTLTSPTINSAAISSGGSMAGTFTGTPTFSGAIVLTQPDINGGSVDGAAIGAASASTGAFTTLSASSTVALSGTTTLSGATSLTGTLQGGSPLIFEGATSNTSQTTFAITEPTTDRTITFPDSTGTVSLITATETLTNKTLTSPSITGAALSSGGSMAGTFTGTPTFSQAVVMTQPDINGGSVDGATIGANSASTGAFTTLSASGAVSLSNTLTVTGTTTFTGASTTVGVVSLNNGSTSAGVLKIYEDSDTGANFTAFQAGNATADVTYTLPTADGTSGQVLSTNGSGTLSWATSSSSGATAALDNLASVAINTSLISDTDATDDLGSSSKKWKDLYLSGSATIGGGAFSGTISGTPTFSDAVVLSQPDINGGSVDGAAIGSASASTGAFTTLSASGAVSLSNTLAVTGTTTFTGASTTVGIVSLNNGSTSAGVLKIYEDSDNGSNFTGFQAGNATADVTYTLPTADGTSGQVLSTDGSGTLSWATDATGGSSTIAARAYASAATSIGTAWTAITFGTESYDTGSDFASNAFTAPSTGYYLVNSCAEIAVKEFALQLKIYRTNNTATDLALGTTGLSGNSVHVGTVTAACVSDLVSLTSGDTIQIYGRIDAGTTNTTASSSQTFFSVIKMGS